MTQHQPWTSSGDNVDLNLVLSLWQQSPNSKWPDCVELFQEEENCKSTKWLQNYVEHLVLLFAQKLLHSSSAKLWRNNEKPQWCTAFLDLICPWHGSPIQLYSTQVVLEMSGTANSPLVAIKVDFLSLKGFSCWWGQKRRWNFIWKNILPSSCGSY